MQIKPQVAQRAGHSNGSSHSGWGGMSDLIGLGDGIGGLEEVLPVGVARGRPDEVEHVLPAVGASDALKRQVWCGEGDQGTAFEGLGRCLRALATLCAASMDSPCTRPGCRV